MKLEAPEAPTHCSYPRISELHGAVNCSLEPNQNGWPRYRGACSLGASMEGRREFAAANLQAESYLERRSVGWAALGVAHVTSGITANVWTSRWPTGFSRATSSIQMLDLNATLQEA